MNESLLKPNIELWYLEFDQEAMGFDNLALFCESMYDSLEIPVYTDNDIAWANNVYEDTLKNSLCIGLAGGDIKLLHHDGKWYEYQFVHREDTPSDLYGHVRKQVTPNFVICSLLQALHDCGLDVNKAARCTAIGSVRTPRDKFPEVWIHAILAK
jgi:hypothetical protein